MGKGNEGEEGLIQKKLRRVFEIFLQEWENLGGFGIIFFEKTLAN